MRLIDADALIKVINDAFDQAKREAGNFANSQLGEAVKITFIETINDMPTVTVQQDFAVMHDNDPDCED